MAETLDTPSSIEMDLHTIDNLRHTTPVYHKREDVLFLRPGNPRPATSIDCNGEMWIRVDPTTGDIVGLEIENFESIFIKNHPQVAEAWRKDKPRFCQNRHKLNTVSFPSIIVDLVSTLLQKNPQQLSYV